MTLNPYTGQTFTAQEIRLAESLAASGVAICEDDYYFLQAVAAAKTLAPPDDLLVRPCGCCCGRIDDRTAKFAPSGHEAVCPACAAAGCDPARLVVLCGAAPTALVPADLSTEGGATR